jgi:uncharacterized protein YdeI (BOF family)
MTFVIGDQRAKNDDASRANPIAKQAGNKKSLCSISAAKEIRHKEKTTMSGKITMALAALVIACVPPALAGGNGNRDNGYTKSAQYCVPQFDDNPDALRVYC